jgi:hypothetical protein
VEGGHPSPQPWAQNLYPPRTTPQSQLPERPTGVVIIAILNIISAAIMFLMGLAMLAFGALEAINPDVGGSFAAALGVIGLILIIIGIAFIVMAWGLLKLRPWARMITRSLAVLGVVFGLPAVFAGDPVSIINVILAFVIFFYLGSRDVKAAFVKPRFSVPQSHRHY